MLPPGGMFGNVFHFPPGPPVPPHVRPMGPMLDHIPPLPPHPVPLRALFRPCFAPGAPPRFPGQHGFLFAQGDGHDEDEDDDDGEDDHDIYYNDDDDGSDEGKEGEGLDE